MLREAGGLVNILLEDCKLLINTVGKGISYYSPGKTYLASIPSTSLLVAHLTNASRKMTWPINLRRVSIMDLLKLTTMRMTHADRWDLTFFGQVVAKNGELVSKTIKMEVNQFVEAVYTQERQDLWAKPTDMGSLEIVVRGLELAVNLLVHI